MIFASLPYFMSIYPVCLGCCLAKCPNSVFNVKAVVDAYLSRNHESSFEALQGFILSGHFHCVLCSSGAAGGGECLLCKCSTCNKTNNDKVKYFTGDQPGLGWLVHGYCIN